MSKYFMLIEELCEKAQIPALKNAKMMFDTFTIPATCDWVALCQTATEKCEAYDIRYFDGEFRIRRSGDMERQLLTTRDEIMNRLLEVLVPRIKPTEEELEGFVLGFLENKAETL